MAEKHEEQLYSEQDLRSLFDAAPDATLLVNTDGRIERLNAQAETLFGYQRKEMLGQPVELLIPQRFRNSHIEHRREFADNPRVRTMGSSLELYARHKDGSEFAIDVNLSPIKLQGRMVVSAAIRDVTELKAAAAALRVAKEEADRATGIKTRFLAAASHDLRQPLQSVGLYLSVMSRQVDDPKAQEIGIKMRQSLDTMGEILDALLDISKLDSGSIVAEPCEFPLQKLLDQIAADNSPLAAEKGLSLHIEPTPLIVKSDPALLRRIIENFVGNALRYTESGEISIFTRSNGDSASIDVSDTGVGIPEDALETIFEEYFQLENPVRDRSKGLGLGLAIVRHIARLLDHKLDVHSVPGQGSTFSVSLPQVGVVSEAVTEPVLSDASTTTDYAATVLIVDDDPAIIDATVMLLKIEGFDVQSALHGDEALAKIEDGLRPDIVVSDYRLPGLNGIEVVRRIRHLVGEDLPTILITGDTSAKEITAANLARCTVLHKPINSERLISLIHESCGSTANPA